MTREKQAGHERGGGDHRRLMIEINVTPLVDVMLVLLIIFMVTAPLLQEKFAASISMCPRSRRESEKVGTQHPSSC
jgi:biopolymer transport protein ExbD